MSNKKTLTISLRKKDLFRIGVAILFLLIGFVGGSVINSTGSAVQAESEPVIKQESNLVLTYLLDSNCNTCYDVTINEKILNSLGVEVSEIVSYEYESPEAKRIIDEYNIQKIPAFILSKEASDNSALRDVWGQVGTIEEDGTLVFRRPEALGGDYEHINSDSTLSLVEWEEPRFNVSIDDDPSIGPKNAGVVVVEFSDFECPYCGAAAGTNSEVITSLKSQLPTWSAPEPSLIELAEEGKILLVFRDLPLAIHENAQKAAEAGECADEQGLFWEMHELLFNNQDDLSIESIKEYAKSITGLDADTFNECLDSGVMAEEVSKDVSDADLLSQEIVKAGGRPIGTPVFFVNGLLVSGAQPFDIFEEIINKELE